MMNDEELIRQYIADCEANGRSTYPGKTLLAIIDHQRKEMKRMLDKHLTPDT